MGKRVIFNEAELAQTADFTDVGLYARADAQAIIGGAVGAPRQWARFTIEQPSAAVLRINPGTLFIDDKAYDSDTLDVDMQIHLPVVTGDTKWAALLVRGAIETISENRLVEIDADTGQTSLQPLPKVERLFVSVVVQAGIAGPTPVKPTPADTECCLAFVLMSPTGVVSVEPGEGWRLKTLYEVTGRVIGLEGDMDAIRQRTSSLETTTANITGQLKTIPRPEIIQQLQRDAAATRRALKLPAAARAYWYDPGLLKDDWDTAHASWLARVREGVRFAYAQIVDAQLSLATPGDPKLRITDSLALPAWTEIARISVTGADGSKDISQQTHTVTDAIQNTVSYSSVSYGPTINVCENNAEWAAVSNVHAGETFNVNGQTYVSAGLTNNGNNYTNQNGFDASQWNADPANEGHKNYAVQQLQYESWSETYWTYITKTVGVNGSIYGQSFLNQQAMVLTAIEVDCTRAGSDGDIHMFVCRCDATGAPQFKNVIASTVVAAAGVHVGKVKFNFTPTLLEPGVRYAWYTVTVGNHALATVSGNKYAQGSLFWATDGAWAQGDNLIDFTFTAYAAQFPVRTVVDFAPLTCPLGMTEIQLLYGGWAPAGTSLTWEIKPTGASAWSPLQPANPNPLVGLPALTQLRATFVGTTDLAPAIKLDSTARGAAMRMRGDMKAISKSQALGFSSTAITVAATVDNFDPLHNTWANKIVKSDGTVVAASATSVAVDYDRPGRRVITSTFALGAAVTDLRVQIESTTDNVVLVPFLQDVTMTAS